MLVSAGHAKNGPPVGLASVLRVTRFHLLIWAADARLRRGSGQFPGVTTVPMAWSILMKWMIASLALVTLPLSVWISATSAVVDAYRIFIPMGFSPLVAGLLAELWQ